MLKKRLVGVVTVKDGWAVQSMGYQRYLPLGKPECIVENLDRWGVDEIVVLAIDRTIRGLGPDFELLAKLARKGISSPLIYGGGIRSVADGVKAVQAGADRVVVDACFQDHPNEVRRLATQLGAQAIIASLPMSRQAQQIFSFDYRAKHSYPLKSELVAMLESGFVSEALVIDWQHEGSRDGFDEDLLHHFHLKNVPLIVFGGITEPTQMLRLLRLKSVAAVAVGNSLNYREFAVQKLKAELNATAIRPPVFESNHVTFLND